jgi:hypothetical protein
VLRPRSNTSLSQTVEDFLVAFGHLAQRRHEPVVLLDLYYLGEQSLNDQGITSASAADSLCRGQVLMVRAGLSMGLHCGTRSNGERHLGTDPFPAMSGALGLGRDLLRSPCWRTAVVLATGYRASIGDILVGWEDVCESSGTPTVSGAPTALGGLYFCGMYVSPAGMLREIGIEATRIATHISM